VKYTEEEIEYLMENGLWDQYTSLYFITYVSSRAWSEFGDAVGGLMRIMARVGFKNLTELQRNIEDWHDNRPDEYTFSFQDQLGRTVTIDRSKAI